MPRLSVDIDLTYLPLDSREDALKNIDEGLNRIKKNIEKNLPDVNVHTVPLNRGTDDKILFDNNLNFRWTVNINKERMFMS